eukprot:Colp12_sorted_trinity150504_noHs@19493
MITCDYYAHTNIHPHYRTEHLNQPVATFGYGRIQLSPVLTIITSFVAPPFHKSHTRSLSELGGVRHSAAALLDNLASSVMTCTHTLRDVLAEQVLAEEPAHKGITSTVGVHNLVSSDRDNGVLGDLAVACNNGGLGALGDHNKARGAAGLGESGQLECNLSNILGPESVLLGEGGCLGLVTEENVPVGGSLHHGLLEELNKEGSRQVHGEGLAGLTGVLGNLEDAIGRDSQEKAGDVEHLGLLHVLPDLGSKKVLLLVVVGGGKVGNQGSVVAGNQHSASASGGGLIDEVRSLDTRGSNGLLHLLTELVLADAANESGGARGRHPLADTDGVLGGTTGDVGDLVLAHKLLEQRLVLVLGKDGIVGLKPILLKESKIDIGGDVEEGVTHAEESSLGGHFVDGILKSSTLNLPMYSALI